MIFDKISEKGVGYASGTFVRVNDDIYYAAAVGRDRLDLYSADGLGRTKKCDLSITDDNSSKYSFLTPTLGYFYVEGMDRTEFPFLSRVPSRVWKVGVCESNVDPARIFGSEESRTILLGLKNIHLKNYPSFQEASASSRKLRIPVPFHRRYAVKEDLIFYKGEALGKIEGMTLKVVSDISASFHTEHLESLTGCRCLHMAPKQVLFGKEDI